MKSYSFDVVNPPGSLSALNALFQAGQGGKATLTLRNEDGHDFTVEVSGVHFEHDASGIVLLDAETIQGALTGRLLTLPTDHVAGKVTISPQGGHAS